MSRAVVDFPHPDRPGRVTHRPQFFLGSIFVMHELDLLHPRWRFRRHFLDGYRRLACEVAVELFPANQPISLV